MVRNLIAGLCLGLAAFGANAASYSFHQDGFTGGGSITGWFTTANPLAPGEQLVYFQGQGSTLTGFGISFSGNGEVPAFTGDLSSLYGLVWDSGDSLLGDGTTGSTEGLALNWGNPNPWEYASGIGPAGGTGGIINFVGATRITLTTTDMVHVVAVPEPETYGLMLAGLGLLGAIARRRKQA